MSSSIAFYFRFCVFCFPYGALLLCFLQAITSVLEIFSIVAVIPLISSLVGPGQDSNFGIVSEVLKFFTQNFDVSELLVSSYLFGGAFILATVARAITIHIQLMLEYKASLIFAQDVFSSIIYKDFNWFISRSAGDVLTIFSHDLRVILGAFLSFLGMVASTILTLALIFFVFSFSNLFLNLMLVFLFVLFLILFGLFKGRVKRMATEIANDSVKYMSLLDQMIRAIREVNIYSWQRELLESFGGYFSKATRKQSQLRFLEHIPRLSVEALVFFVVFLILVPLWISDNVLSEVLPLLGAGFFGFVRALPHFQAISRGCMAMSSVAPSIERVMDSGWSFERLSYGRDPKNTPQNSGATHTNRARLDWRSCEIELSEVSYSVKSIAILDRISISFPPNVKRVAVIGKSGSGKSSLLDLLSGLTTPSSGRIKFRFADGSGLNLEDLPANSLSVGYVGQRPVILNDTIIANVAGRLGGRYSSGDEARVTELLNTLGLSDFLEQKPLGLYTEIGLGESDGLSGGQAQRLCLARALFKIPDLLFLDEVTSSLDKQSEALVLDLLSDKSLEKCRLFYVTHGKELIPKTDLIVKLELGAIAELVNVSSAEEDPVDL